MDGIVLPLREQLIGVSFDLTPASMTMLAILLFLLPLLVSSKNYDTDTAALGKKVIEIYFVPHFDKKREKPQNS